MDDPSSSGGWRFAQCFGDKGDVEDITEGWFYSSFAACHTHAERAGCCGPRTELTNYLFSVVISRHHLDGGIRLHRKLPCHR